MQYQVKDISLAGFGRKEIEIAEKEMPGLLGDQEEIFPGKTFERGTHNRFLAHDYPDSCFD